MNHASLKSEIRQTASLTPRLQYAVRLLQLSALDYEQELQEISVKNPFLDWGDSSAQRAEAVDIEGDTPGSDPRAAASSADHDDGAPRGDDGNEPGMETWSGDAGQTENWTQAPGADRNASVDAQGSALDRVEAGTDLRQHLRHQANMLTISARDHALVCAVIESLDDDGYLRIDSDEIVVFTALEPPADGSEVNTALKLVQSFEPAGVGARGVAECLSLQLEKIDAGLRALARAIVTDHLDRLAQRDIGALTKLLDRSPRDIEAACHALRRLDPRPGWRFTRADVHFVAPDVVVCKLRGRWVAQLNSAVVPRLRLNRGCADLFEQHRGKRHVELSTHLKEARWMLRNVEQRCSTILAVAQAILRRQHLFFEHGPLAMKPLALRDIANEIGVHESTVCRVTNNKYMTTPAGLFEMKRFFSRPMALASGGACSPIAIRGVLKEMVDSENLNCPLSDADIARKLERQGVKVARRTVTKYRQMLRIAPADRRRTHATQTA